jgi:hypothetical protein
MPVGFNSMAKLTVCVVVVSIAATREGEYELTTN